MIILLHYGQNQGIVLASAYPELAQQWNYDKNGALTPWDVTIGSGRKVWWKCSLGHEWEAPPNNRTHNSTGCPYCAGKKAWPGFNDLASLRPDLAAEWNEKRNGGLTPQMVTAGSSKKVWWKCSLGHEWEAVVCARASQGRGCPYCAGRNAWPGFNDLATKRPDVAADWDYNLNGKKRPIQYTVFSAEKVWWVCRRGHPSYQARIYNRSNGRGCPKCRPGKIADFHSKKVYCYAPDGRLHGAYPSILNAARETGKSRSTVGLLAAGKRKSRNKYAYRFEDQPPVNDPSPTVEGRFRDCLSQPVSVGDSVMIIRWGETRMPKLIRGRVAKVAESCVYIQPENGKLVRQLVSKDDPEFLPRLLVLRPRPERALEGELDASGYPVREGDPVVYMLPLVYMNCRELLFGTAHRTADSFWLVDGAKVPTSRMVVANWE